MKGYELKARYLAMSPDKSGRLEDLISEFSNITLVYGRINLTRMLEHLSYEGTVRNFVKNHMLSTKESENINRSILICFISGGAVFMIVGSFVPYIIKTLRDGP